MSPDPRTLLRAGRHAEALAEVARLRRQQSGGPLELWAGLAHQGLGQLAAAEQAFQRAVAARPRLVLAWLALGRLRFEAGAYQRAVAPFESALALRPDDPEVLRSLGMARLYANQPEAAAAVLDRAVAVSGGAPALRWLALQVLPILPSSAAQAAHFRRRYCDGLARLAADLENAPLSVLPQALAGSWDAFYLHYQGEAFVEEQRLLGSLLHSLARRLAPELAGRRPVPPREPDGRLRVGLASTSWRRHTVSVLFGDWVRRLDRSRCSVYLYQLGDQLDETSAELAAAADHVRRLPGAPWLPSARAMARDQLHALVFPELGMDRRLLRIAALRLAPVQAVSWGHPVTTGLPTVDLFLSSAAMEGPGAAEHYTERLVTLPGLGTCLPRPPPPPGRRSRAHFGLEDDAVVYLVPQFPSKLRPQDDHLYADIAAGQPRARFVFVLAGRGQTTPGVRQTLLGRLQRAFAARGLPVAPHVRLLPGMDHGDFLDLNALSDVFLDAPGWSGGRTTSEALACGLLPVSLPGPLMRQRHTAAMLELVGLPELVARDRDHYVALALQLGGDPAWRAELQDRLCTGLSRLFAQQAPVDALVHVLEAAVEAQEG